MSDEPVRSVPDDGRSVKYKALKSAAHNLGDSFASTLNYAAGDYIMSHLARRALASGQTELRVDVLTGQAGPPELMGPPMDECIAERVRRLPSLLASQRVDPAVVREARMRIVFDTAHCTAPASVPGYPTSEVPFDCWVTLVDDRGTAHTAHFRRSWAFDVGDARSPQASRPSVWQRVVTAVRRPGRRRGRSGAG